MKMLEEDCPLLNKQVEVRRRYLWMTAPWYLLGAQSLSQKQPWQLPGQDPKVRRGCMLEQMRLLLLRRRRTRRRRAFLGGDRRRQAVVKRATRTAEAVGRKAPQRLGTAAAVIARDQGDCCPRRRW